MRKVLVTGAAGYIGSVLTTKLLANGFLVRGVDILRFGGESLFAVYNHPAFEFVKADIRDVDAMRELVSGVDAVVHLAAIVGDPACAKESKLAEETNWVASCTLFDLCNQSRNVKRFVFASTCSNYGKMENDVLLNENSPLRPVSLYARLKVQFEQYLLSSKIRMDFTPTALRFATVYGLSPRMRFDLTVNEFMREATLKGKLAIFGEQFWRPYCHVDDLARSCVLVLQSDPQKVDHNVFGVGDTGQNYQKKMLAEEISKIIPGVSIQYVKSDEDPRDYRVDFSKIKAQLGFNITKTVPDGLNEIHSILQSGLISDPYAKRYSNT
jgi:nucleoside-diphosphate-sugar epimerase